MRYFHLFKNHQQNSQLTLGKHETHFHLSEVRNMVESLQKRVHVTRCSLVLKSNITSLLFWVIWPVIQNLANSNLSFDDACVIYEVPSSRVIKITERHEWCETPVTLSCIELVLCVCKNQIWRSKIMPEFFILKNKNKKTFNIWSPDD